MAKPREIEFPDGTKVTAVDVPFDIIKEGQNEYKLEDGATVLVRTIVSKIARVLDTEGKPAYTPQGEPRLIVSSQNIVTARD